MGVEDFNVAEEAGMKSTHEAWQEFHSVAEDFLLFAGWEVNHVELQFHWPRMTWEEVKG